MKSITVSGKRKRAIAKATIRQGTGMIRVNHVPVALYQPKMSKLKLEEPLILAGEVVNKINIDVSVAGGGVSSQAEAARLAIAKSIIIFTKNDKLRQTFLTYDRNMLVADVRRKEPSKPNRHGQARAKVQKSYR